MQLPTWVQRTLHRLPLRWIFETLYSVRDDPWNYQGSAFEQERYRRMLDLLRALPPPWNWPQAQVLEVGASVGTFTTQLLTLQPAAVTALDISSVALRRARRRCPPSVRFVCADIFRDHLEGRYHLIVASDVLGYTSDLEKLQRARDHLLECLLPGGCLLLGNTKLRSADGEGWDGFNSGFPLLGASVILDCFLEKMTSSSSIIEPKYRIDLLVR